MHDLRKKALLESGKTQSRKARSRPDSKSATPLTSPGHSPAGSRAPSRYASEDEGDSDSDFDDMMTMSTTSGTSDHGDDDGTGRAWVDRVNARVSQIVAGGRSGERKKISNQEREDMLKSYLHLARHYYVHSEIEAPMNDLVLGLVRAIKSGVSATERTLALKALSVTILTNPTDTILDQYVTSLKSTCEDDGAEEVKTAALRALAVAAMYGDGSTEAAEDMMLYMLDIIESDGHTAGAADVAPVVVAALECWGFMAAHLEDLSDQSSQAMEAFVEQLNSTDAYVQTSAGNNIALLFESATEWEESSGEKMNLRYDPKRLAQQMRDASRGSKSMSKRDRRHLKSDFNSIATGLERGKGPGYSTAGWAASNPHTGGNAVVSSHGGDVSEFGYRQTISVGKDKMTIDSWALSAKVDFLRTVLAGGFPTHLAKNETVQEMI